MLAPVGYFRFEDPAGEVGIETHLMTDGQVALTDSDDLPPDPDGARPAEEPGVAGDGAPGIRTVPVQQPSTAALL